MTHIEVERNCTFNDPDDYIFDDTKIEVTGGVAKLLGSPTLPYAHWQMNETSPSSSVADTGPNNYTGTVTGDLTFVSGKLNNAKYFDGSTFLDFGNILSWDRSDSFSFEFWVDTTDGSGYILQKITSPGGQLKGIAINILSGKIRFALYGNNSNQLIVETVNTMNDGIYHHIVITYDGSSTAAGVKIYFDNIEQSKTTVSDTLGVPISNTAILRLGGFGGSNFTGDLDEFLLYDRELGTDEITFRYNSGTGTEFLYNGYSIDKDTIINECALLFEGPIESFIVTDTIPARTGIRYQVSIDGGNTFQYWTGSAWAAITADQTDQWYYTNETNIDTEIDTNISTIGQSGNLKIKTFLGSDDSYYTPEIDNIEVTYIKEEEISTYYMTSKFS